MAQVIVELSGDEKRVLESYRKSVEADKAYRESLKKTGVEGAKVGGEIADGFVAGGKRAGKESIDPILKGLSRLGPEGREMRRELEKHFQATGKHGRKSMDTIVKKLGELDPEAAKVARRSSKSFKGFSDSSVASLKSVAFQYIALNNLAGQFLKVSERVAETNKQAADTALGDRTGTSLLAQVAKTPEDLARLEKKRNDLAVKYGLGRDTTAELLFKGRSTGFEGKEEFLASNFAGGIGINLDAQATVAGKVPEIFKSQGITAEQAINATQVGAAKSFLDFGQIGATLPSLAASTAPLGSTFQETIGAQSVLAGQFGSGEEASTRISAFASRANLDERLSGRGLTEAIRIVRDEFSEADRAKFIGGSKEMAEAYNSLIANFDAIVKRTVEVDTALKATGTAASPEKQFRENIMSSPKNQAILRQQQANARLEVARSRRATEELNSQADVSTELASSENAGVSRFAIGAAELTSWGLRGFGMNDMAAAMVPAIAGGPLGNLSRDLGYSASGGDSDASQLMVATNQLSRRRADSATAILSADEVASFAAGTTGRQLRPDQVSVDMREELTRLIDAASEETAGFGRTLSAGVPLVGGLASGDSAQSASATTDRIVASIERLIAVQMMTTDNTKQTAKSVNPRNRRNFDQINNVMGPRRGGLP